MLSLVCLNPFPYHLGDPLPTLDLLTSWEGAILRSDVICTPQRTKQVKGRPVNRWPSTRAQAGCPVVLQMNSLTWGCIKIGQNRETLPTVCFTHITTQSLLRNLCVPEFRNHQPNKQCSKPSVRLTLAVENEFHSFTDCFRILNMLDSIISQLNNNQPSFIS